MTDALVRCTICGPPASVATRSSPTPTEREFVQRLARLQQSFVRSAGLERVRGEVAQFAAEVDADLVLADRECGAHHSADAPPRCGRCAAILDDSPFHISLRAATGAPDRRTAAPR